MRRLLILAGACASLLVICAAPVYAQSPEEVQEGRAVGFVRAMQGGNVDSLLAYMRANWVPAADGSDREERWQNMAPMLIERHSDVTIAGVLADQPNHLTVVATDPDGPELSFQFDFEASPPYRISGMGVQAGRPMQGPELPPLEIAAGSSDAAIAAELKRWFGALANDSLLSGTALVAIDGKAIFSGAYGMASRRWNIPNRVDTRFDLGSINKSFTRIAIGQLAADGKIALGDNVAKHLPNYPNQDVAQRITIAQLLDHSSGLGDIFNERFFNASKDMFRSPSDFFPLFADQPLKFEPGSRSEYSNAGYMVLGAIIEAVSGMAYDQYVIDHIFKPAGMLSSGFWAHDDVVPNIAEGYTKNGVEEGSSAWRSNVLMLPAKGNSAGSAQSTVGDLLAFDNALREHRLLSPEYTTWFSNGPAPDGASKSRATDTRATFPMGIAGGAPGVSADLESNGKVTVIVLSNTDPPTAEDAAQAVFRVLRDVVK